MCLVVSYETATAQVEMKDRYCRELGYLGGWLYTYSHIFIHTACYSFIHVYTACTA